MSTSGSSTQTVHHSGIRSQLAHLRPKHSLFLVKLNIHQVSSVPYVHGEFGVKWRFNHVVSSGPNSGLLSKIRGHRSTSGQSSVKGKEKATEGPEIVVHDHDEEDGDTGSAEEQEHDSLRDWGRSGVNMSSLSLNHLKPEPTSPKLPASLSPMSTPSDSQSSLDPNTVYSDARGMTEYLPLREHSVKWEHAVNVVVQMDVQRDTLNLLPNELKLVVRQRVIPGDPDSLENPRLGHVILNLAEYVGAGPVTRNYLLRQSKTNAVLKLTTDVQYVGGEKAYKAPPLRKGEILAGVAGLLHNEVYRSPAWLNRTLDLYGEHSDGVRSADPDATVTSRKGVPFELDQLPSAFGPRTTETLIEAIFNPVPTTSMTSSPFTYYVPPGSEKAKELDGGAEDGRGGGSSGSASVDSEKQSVLSGTDSASALTSSGMEASPSLATSDSNSEVVSANGSGRHKGWWSRKIGGYGSRPGTPNLLKRQAVRTES
ncbi:hypothetical protein NEOLEDRAFT_261250 [Neolentinus lepideus HHB14362 ss-1]|uniref:C2 NT-type domain-containing protein n=1 Tax=Neolentinus lepideus HHB14362 ss-1 TaxID=1314782 RepID=A0A165T1Y5_9AGAM|nr:hypothetical protein NEOLEDRAFT_261250 [Neolentinus lepideus HHB14362 ss-1]